LNTRKHIRSTLSAAVEITPEGSHCIHAELVDLSTNGMLIHSEEQLQVGQACQILLLLGDSANKFPINSRGKIVRANRNHFAIQFSSVGFGEAEVLERSILINADDPEACVKEFALSAFLFDPLSVASFAPYPSL